MLFVSRLAREKNIDVVIDALSRTRKGTRLIVVGDGPEYGPLQELAERLSVAQCVRFLGSVERDRLPELYASADAFVFPSVTETQGLVLAEALAAGCLVLVADAPQNREVVGSAGRVVPAEPDAFARAMDEVPAAPDPSEAARARAAAALFGIDEQARKIVSLYERLQSQAFVS